MMVDAAQGGQGLSSPAWMASLLPSGDQRGSPVCTPGKRARSPVPSAFAMKVSSDPRRSPKIGRRPCAHEPETAQPDHCHECDETTHSQSLSFSMRLDTRTRCFDP